MKLKKFLSALVSGAMILGTLAAVPVFADEGAVAKIGDVEYTSLADALKFAGAANAGSNTIEIIKDIDLTNVEWTPVYVDGYNGADIVTVKGNGHTISHISAPLFSGGFAGGSGIVIDDLTIKDSTIVSNNAIGSGAFIESVDSMNKITLTKCNLIDSTVTGTRTGGLLGWTAGYNNVNDGPVKTYVTISNCSVSGSTIVGESVGAINGHAGNNAWTYTTIENCTIENNTIKSIEQDDWRAGIVLGTANVGEVTINNITAVGNTVYNTNGHTRGEGRTELVGRFVPGTTGKLTIDGVPYANNCKPYPVIINGNYYATLAEAVAAAQNGNVVTLLDDITLTSIISLNEDKAITLDLNGKTLSCEGGRIMLNGADMTVTGNGTIKAVLWEEENESKGSQTAIEVLDADSTLTIDSVNVSAGANNMIFAAGNGGSIIINGGTYTVTDGGTCFYVFDKSKLTINNGIFNGTGHEGTGIVWAFNGSDVKVYNGTFNVENDTTPYPGITSNVNWTFCDYRGLIGYPFTESLPVNSKGNIQIYGGTYNVNPNKMPNLGFGSSAFISLDVDYVAPGYVSTKNANGTYTVAQSEATVIDTAKTTGATVTLDNLTKNAAIDHEPDATYKVVVSTPAAADADAANTKIASIGDTNTSKAMFDISVVKIDSNGVETDLSDLDENSIKDQQVTLTLGETPTGTVHVYHVVGGSAVEITPVTVSGNKVSFIAPSFSTYTVTYNTGAVAANTITEKVGVVFSPVSEGSNQYYINLKSLDGKSINRFMSTDLVFKNGCATVDYDITPAANMTASVVSENGTSREYRFNMDGRVASSATGTGITIGTITFYGYGTLNFGINTDYVSGHAINIVNTAEAANNIVANYIADGDARGNLLVNDAPNYAAYRDYIEADEKGVITDTLAPETKDLTVNVKFNNSITDNAIAYQDMKAVISGGDLLSDITVNFGTGELDLNGDTYTFTKALTQNVSYTVTVSGAGYRTARYTVNLNADKTLNFWNNVMDVAQVVEVDKQDSAVNTNFLAGDIVKDNNINIYDLSAVVSYFGTSNDVNAESAYARYDLNRDGVIDSKDIAYVLVSWNN